MVSSPISGQAGTRREEPEVFLDSENPVSRRLPSRYQVNYPPDSWEVLFNVSSPFTYASPLVGSSCEYLIRVVLPAPLGAEEAENFSLLNLKVNTLQCDNVSGPGLL